MLSAGQLDALVAPIALYPDALLSEILMASTYPLEVVEADRWAEANKNLKGDALKAAVDQQSWDDSVKSLVATPSVLDMMSDKLDWTQQLGDAVLAQQPDVMDAIQRLRTKAQANNKLASNKQQTVSTQQQNGKQVIVIAPTHPDTIYVPYYDPAVVYGAWPYPAYPPYYWPAPGYIAAGVIATGLAFGAGYALGRWAPAAVIGAAASIGAATTSTSTATSTSTISTAAMAITGCTIQRTARACAITMPMLRRNSAAIATISPAAHRTAWISVAAAATGTQSRRWRRQPAEWRVAAAMQANIGGGNRPSGGNRPNAGSGGGNRPDAGGGANRPGPWRQSSKRRRRSRVLRERIRQYQFRTCRQSGSRRGRASLGGGGGGADAAVRWRRQAVAAVVAGGGRGGGGGGRRSDCD